MRRGRAPVRFPGVRGGFPVVRQVPFRRSAMAVVPGSGPVPSSLVGGTISRGAFQACPEAGEQECSPPVDPVGRCPPFPALTVPASGRATRRPPGEFVRVRPRSVLRPSPSPAVAGTDAPTPPPTTTRRVRSIHPGAEAEPPSRPGGTPRPKTRAVDQVLRTTPTVRAARTARRAGTLRSPGRRPATPRGRSDPCGPPLRWRRQLCQGGKVCARPPFPAGLVRWPGPAPASCPVRVKPPGARACRGGPGASGRRASRVARARPGRRDLPGNRLRGSRVRASRVQVSRVQVSRVRASKVRGSRVSGGRRASPARRARVAVSRARAVNTARSVSTAETSSRGRAGYTALPGTKDQAVSRASVGSRDQSARLGSQARGSQARGSQARGSQARGSQARGSQARGSRA